MIITLAQKNETISDCLTPISPLQGFGLLIVSNTSGVPRPVGVSYVALRVFWKNRPCTVTFTIEEFISPKGKNIIAQGNAL